MKRSIVWTIMLVSVFALGYWTARSPLFVREEMPPASEIAEMREQRQLASFGDRQLRQNQVMGTLAFLKRQVENAEADYRRTGTSESKATLDNMRHKLDLAQAAMKVKKP